MGGRGPARSRFFEGARQPCQQLAPGVVSAVREIGGAFMGGATIHAATGASYDFQGGAWTNLILGDWTELTLDLTGVAAAGDVRQIGVQFDTGDPDDGGTFGSALATTFHIDSFTNV